jgi:hypothetical protein
MQSNIKKTGGFMKRNYLIFLLMMLTALSYATQTTVVGEVFTETW